MQHLPFNDTLQRGQLLGRYAADVGGSIADGCRRIAQFVRKHGHELGQLAMRCLGGYVGRQPGIRFRRQQHTTLYGSDSGPAAQP